MAKKKVRKVKAQVKARAKSTKKRAKKVPRGRPRLSPGGSYVLSASIPVELLGPLERWAAARGKSRSQAVAEAIRRLTGARH